MEVNMNELKQKIAEQNVMLNSLQPENKKNLEKKRSICIELDKLLYVYFKALVCA